MKLEMEINEWKGFMRALRRDDSEAFEELMNHCRGYAMAAGAAVRPIITEAMFMSILLAHEKELEKIKTSLEELAGRGDKSPSLVYKRSSDLLNYDEKPRGDPPLGLSLSAKVSSNDDLVRAERKVES
jgi:hypothetical protein